MNTTWYEKGIEKGRRETLRQQLESRFGPLPSSVLERLQEWPTEGLAELATGVLRAESLRDLGLED
jgi:hypothetical protein